MYDRNMVYTLKILTRTYNNMEINILSLLLLWTDLVDKLHNIPEHLPCLPYIQGQRTTKTSTVTTYYPNNNWA